MSLSLALLLQIYVLFPRQYLSSDGDIQCFGDLTKVYWQFVSNRVNQEIILRYNNSDAIGPVLWTQSPWETAMQYTVLQSVYFSADIINQHNNLQLDLIHVNSEWNHALQQNFAIWPLSITANWVELYPHSILKHSVLHSPSSTDYTITNDTAYISKPDWIDFPILFYNTELLEDYDVNISSITSWQALFEVASRIQQCTFSSILLIGSWCHILAHCILTVDSTEIHFLYQHLGIPLLSLPRGHHLCSLGVYQCIWRWPYHRGRWNHFSA